MFRPGLAGGRRSEQKNPHTYASPMLATNLNFKQDTRRPTPTTTRLTAKEPLHQYRAKPHETTIDRQSYSKPVGKPVEAPRTPRAAPRYQSVAVLNMASAASPGGGYRSGAGAQDDIRLDKLEFLRLCKCNSQRSLCLSLEGSERRIASFLLASRSPRNATKDCRR